MENNIEKIGGATINNTISSLFNNCTLYHPSLTDNQYLYINKKANFIRVGNESEYKDFNDWNAAAEYANNRKGEFYVAVRANKAVKANVMATIKNVKTIYVVYETIDDGAEYYENSPYPTFPPRYARACCKTEELAEKWLDEYKRKCVEEYEKENENDFEIEPMDLFESEEDLVNVEV